MFNSVSTLQQGIEKIRAASDDAQFQIAISGCISYLVKRNYDSKLWKELEGQAYYQKNDYSDMENVRNLCEAKKRTISYIENSIIKGEYGTTGDFSESEKVKILCKMVGNFHEFLVALWTRIPHQKAGTRKEAYDSIKICNEYDLQHLMYAYLKPVFLEIRDEIPEDSGYSGTRVDLKIDENIVVETKCSRASMTEHKLIEEISSDIVLYKHGYIVIYVYDRERIIKNVHAFRNNFNNITEAKKVFIFVDQPLEL